MFTQKITPIPLAPKAEEGMCLQYVRQAYGLPARFASATEAWNNSPSRHPDRTFPAGVDHPVHYGLASNVNGHIVIRMRDGSVYSTSDLNPTPLHHHPSLADLEAYYAYYNVPLTYRGWTEDVAGTPVIVDNGSAAIAPQGTIEKEIKDIMTAAEDAARTLLKMNIARMDRHGKQDDITTAETVFANFNQTMVRLFERLDLVDSRQTAFASTTHQKLNALTALVQATAAAGTGLTEAQISAAIDKGMRSSLDSITASTVTTFDIKEPVK